MLTLAGYIKDSNGENLSLKYYDRKTNDRTHYDFAVYRGLKQIGEFEFDHIDGEDYATVDLVSIDIEERGKGIYSAVLIAVKDFFKRQGMKGLLSQGKSRNSKADKAWIKIGATPKESNGYTDYVFENIKSRTEFEQFTNSKGGEFWGDQGAGILPICRSTGKILVAMRSDFVNEPATWGIFGGAMDENETPKEAATRELLEETQYKGKFELIPAYVFESKDKTFRYHNFIGVVEKEFEPTFDWETSYAEWVTLDELMELDPKHFGLESLLKESIQIIKRFAK